MKHFAIFAGAGLMALSSIGSAGAQPPVSGTPSSPFPFAAPHEVQTIDGRACRTVFDDRTQRRVPVECVEPGTTGSVVLPEPRLVTDGTTTGTAVSGTPGSPFPFAAPHEIQTINGRQCRTVFDDRTQKRVPVECVQ
jgi:hypothetical protein